MKRIICLLLIIALSVVPVSMGAEEDYDMTIAPVCEMETIEVGDQFLVSFKLEDAKEYLTFQMNGSFDVSLAQIIAPVYNNRKLGVVDNSFNNESGVFNLVCYDQTMAGISEDITCSILFEAKAAGKFVVTLTDKTKLGKADENAFYKVGVNETAFLIVEDTDGQVESLIKDTPPVTPYDDMLGYDWAEKAVGVMYKLGALENIADTSFRPGENITRGDFLTMLVRVCKLKSSAEIEPFVDVDSESYQYEPLRIAKALAIAKGDGEGVFNPDSSISRQDVCALVYRTMLRMNKVNPKIETDKYIGDFGDYDQIAPYAIESMAGLIRAKIIIGDENKTLRPNDCMTRAEAAVLLNKLAEYNILVSR